MEQERIHTIISGGKAYPLHDSSAAVDIDNLEAENERQANSIKTNAAAVEAERNRAIEAENALDEKIENLPLATTENDGLMSKDDKAKIDTDDKFSDFRADIENIRYGLINETTRATEAENELANTIESETTRATNAEKELNDNLASEIEKLKDGDTIVGQAREIHSKNGKTVPDNFLIRTTAGSGTIGDGVATLKSVGGNIVKNLVDGALENVLTTKESTFTKKDGLVVWNINGKPENGYYAQVYFNQDVKINGHIYYTCVNLNPNGSLCHLSANGGTNSVVTNANKYVFISHYKQHSDSNAKRVLIRVYPHDERDNQVVYLKDWFAIDLTEMFGAGNEPNQATCDRLFGCMDALPQGLSIANPTEFKSTGFNQFNPAFVKENKVIKTTDDEGNAISPYIANGDKKLAIIPCLPCKVGVGENNGYCIHGEFGEDIRVYLTPLNPMEVEGELYMHELTKDETSNTYVPLIKGYMIVEVPTTDNLCVHLKWSADVDEYHYEPYHESVVKLPVIPEMSEWGLAGIQSGGTLVCDEIDFERGVYRKNIGCVDLGSLGWLKNGAVTDTVYQYLSTEVPSIANTSKYILDIALNIVKIMVRDDGKILVNSTYFDDKTAFIQAMQGVMLYYELAEPIEYPLPKFDNNYISSDYGVEQFNGGVPCNANNLYYMRRLAGETRNFLDKMYDNTGKESANEVADYITNNIAENKQSVISETERATQAEADAIEKGRQLALRSLFIAAGAEYNDTDEVIIKQPVYCVGWNETIEHKPKCYMLNGIGDLTEAEMRKIYTRGYFVEGMHAPLAYNLNRTNLGRIGMFDSVKGCERLAYESGSTHISLMTGSEGTFTMKSGEYFYNAKSLKKIYGVLEIPTYYSTAFYNCTQLERVKIKIINANIYLGYSPMLSNRSVLFMIKYATATAAITITLHPDVYARVAEDAEIVAALEAQPLITLVTTE